MEFGIEKHAMLIMKYGKGETTEAVELPNKKIFKTLGEKENYKYLRVLEADTIKQAEIFLNA